MYGLILENMVEYIKKAFGEEKWEEVRRASQVDTPSFSVHQVYPENLIPRLAKTAFKVRELFLLRVLVVACAAGRDSTGGSRSFACYLRQISFCVPTHSKYTQGGTKKIAVFSNIRSIYSLLNIQSIEKLL